MLKGGWFCGRVRYEADANPTHATACHCSICRRASAAPFVAWFTVKPGEFTFQSDRHPGEIDVTTCSLDDPEQVPPKFHIWRASGISWVKTADGVPAYPEKRPA
jgi:hypothetical protein